MMAAKRTNSAPSRSPATVQKSLALTVEAARRNPLFTRGEDVEVRTRLPQVSGKEVVIYVRAKVVSASAGTHSYLVEYPAANNVPSRVERVPAFDVRAPPRVLPPPLDSAVDVARPASSKRPLPSNRGDGDCCKKAKVSMGKGIPKDALRRFSAEHEKAEEAKKKARGHAAELPAPKLLPAPVKAAVTARDVAAREKSNTVTMMAAKRISTAPLRLPAPKFLPAPVKAAVTARDVAAREKSNTVTMMAAKRISTAPLRLPATVKNSLAPTAETARQKPRFAPGEDVVVRSRFSQESGKRNMVTYEPAKVVSASAGTDSYLVRYPAANNIPSCTARVPASDVRAARRVSPPQHST